jgi:hypothetical protein
MATTDDQHVTHGRTLRCNTDCLRQVHQVHLPVLVQQAQASDVLLNGQAVSAAGAVHPHYEHVAERVRRLNRLPPHLEFGVWGRRAAAAAQHLGLPWRAKPAWGHVVVKAAAVIAAASRAEGVISAPRAASLRVLLTAFPGLSATVALPASGPFVSTVVRAAHRAVIGKAQVNAETPDQSSLFLLDGCTRTTLFEKLDEPKSLAN